MHFSVPRTRLMKSLMTFNGFGETNLFFKTRVRPKSAFYNETDKFLGKIGLMITSNVCIFFFFLLSFFIMFFFFFQNKNPNLVKNR